MSKKQRILIVDDVPDNIHVLMDILGGDYVLQAATNGIKALEFAQQKARPDLVLLDIKMPEMDGFEVLKRLKANKETETIPVIFVTALTDVFDETIGLELGAVDYITKPISAPVIKARVKTHLELFAHKQALEMKVKELSLTEDELRKANERLKELDKLKSMFIASMSHELRTPLNSIIGFTGMMLQGVSGELNEEQEDNLNRVYRSGQHLLGLISDVIDISKIEAGRIEVFPQHFDLKELIGEALELIQPQADKKHLVLDLTASSWPEMFTDRKRLLQCLLNYLSNAVKFTEQGAVRVIIKELNGDVEIAVSDTGIGIAEDGIPKLFEAFERLESHLRIKVGGSGLGLYLTKKIAHDLLQGDVHVVSEVKKGSTFSIRIPKAVRLSSEDTEVISS
ncbi:MAG: hybrid sensor histidine kinase/response regulator [Candidatus Sedimenticola sp. (ex Thyasira tokunagai)]